VEIYSLQTYSQMTPAKVNRVLAFLIPGLGQLIFDGLGAGSPYISTYISAVYA
jgi:hypothetical protein